jgi:hypothetical protein
MDLFGLNGLSRSALAIAVICDLKAAPVRRRAGGEERRGMALGRNKTNGGRVIEALQASGAVEDRRCSDARAVFWCLRWCVFFFRESGFASGDLPPV